MRSKASRVKGVVDREGGDKDGGRLALDCVPRLADDDRAPVHHSLARDGPGRGAARGPPPSSSAHSTGVVLPREGRPPDERASGRAPQGLATLSVKHRTAPAEIADRILGPA
jgi:hypothetical protein